MKHFESMQDVRVNDATVANGLDGGIGLEKIIVALANDKQHLVKRIMELELIAPRKFKVGNQTLVWRCPFDLIPETKLDAPTKNTQGY